MTECLEEYLKQENVKKTSGKLAEEAMLEDINNRKGLDEVEILREESCGKTGQSGAQT